MPVLPRTFPVVLRPARGKAILTLLGCLAFAVVGGFMVVFAESYVEVAGGLLCVLFFGVGGLFAAPRLLRQEPVLILEDRGLRPADGGFLAWDNVAEAGVTRIQENVKCLGVRIVDHAAYASSWSEAERERLRSGMWMAKGAATAAAGVSALQPDFAITMLGRDDRDDLRALLSVPGGADLARAVAWNRRTTGWDLVWPQSVLNHRVEDIRDRCNELRAGP